MDNLTLTELFESIYKMSLKEIRSKVYYNCKVKDTEEGGFITLSQETLDEMNLQDDVEKMKKFISKRYKVPVADVIVEPDNTIGWKKKIE